MEAPKLSGYTRDQRWYEMNAQGRGAGRHQARHDRAGGGPRQDRDRGQEHDLPVGEGRACTTARPASSISTATSILKSSSGFEMHLDEAIVDTGSGEVVSNKPVEVFTQDSTLNADRLEVEKSGDIVRFIGSVVMNLERRSASPNRRRRSHERERDQALTRRDAALRWPPSRPCCAGAARQPASPPNALQGFQQNRGQPVQIEASRLEVRDKDKVATFTGNVKVVQGDTTMRCKTLVVFYEQQNKDGQQAQAAAQDHAGREARPRRLVADQQARSQRRRHRRPEGPDRHRRHARLFDMKSNTVTLLGNVLVSQGPNVMRGEKLVVDLTTGVSRVDAGKRPGSHADSAGAAAGQGGAAGAGRPKSVRRARVVEIDELSGHRGRAVESLPPSDYHGSDAAAEPRSWTADVLDELLTLFRRRRGPRAAKAGSSGRQPMADQSGNDGRADRPWPPRSNPPRRAARCRRAGAMRRPTTGSRRRRMRSIPSNTRRRSRTKCRLASRAVRAARRAPCAATRASWRRRPPAGASSPSSSRPSSATISPRMRWRKASATARW